MYIEMFLNMLLLMTCTLSVDKDKNSILFKEIEEVQNLFQRPLKVLVSRLLPVHQIGTYAGGQNTHNIYVYKSGGYTWVIHGLCRCYPLCGLR